MAEATLTLCLFPLTPPPPPTHISTPLFCNMSGAVNENGPRGVEIGVGRPQAILKLTQDELHYLL